MIGSAAQPRHDTVLTLPTRGSNVRVSSHRGYRVQQIIVQQMIDHMKVLKLSEATIWARAEVLARLCIFTNDEPLLDVTPETLMRYQRSYAHNSPATVNIYTRHLREFYRWATASGLLRDDPSAALPVPKVHRGKPHPTLPDDMKVIFSCSRGYLRTVYILAAFAGLRCGEVCRLHSRDLYLQTDSPHALIHGKGGKERYVPLLPAVVSEIGWTKGHIIVNRSGHPMSPASLSAESSRFLTNLGLQTTLHSLRHYFGTEAYRITHDPLLVRDLMGHESVASTEIYTDSNTDRAHEKLAGLETSAERLLRPRHLAAVSGG